MPDDAPREDAAATDADSDAAADADADRSPERDDEVSRRWLIRLLVGLGVGVPILVEARTLYHIVTGFLFGDGDGTPSTTQATTAQSTTGIGDELLPETEPGDTLSDAELRVADDGWVFHATATVENTGDAPYTLSLGAVTTENGTRVDGGAATGRVPVGGDRLGLAEWVVPTGETPDTLAVTAVVHADGGDERVERSVRLGSIPTRG